MNKDSKDRNGYNFNSDIKKIAFIDLETTGTSFRRDKIIEIAILICHNNTIIESFTTLINPGRTIPPHITKITKITTRMITESPYFYEVAKRVVQMTDDAVLVAHNVRFDYSFLVEEFRQLGYTYTRKRMCTLQLSRHILPAAKAHDLRSLCHLMEVKISPVHRALSDVMAIYELFFRLNDHRGEDLPALASGASKLPYRLPLSSLDDIPKKCGVYYFYNESGEVIYIGKSMNIRQRVVQHFGDHTTKAFTLHQRVAEVDYFLTGSELVALLFESDEIKRLQPCVNRSQRRKSHPFAIFTFEDEYGYRNFTAGRINQQQRWNCIRRYSSLAHARQKVRKLLGEFELCQHKCGDRTGSSCCFNFQIGSCKGACCRREEPKEYNVRVRKAIAKLLDGTMENFALVDCGRTANEQVVIVVKNGYPEKFGFLEKNSWENPSFNPGVIAWRTLADTLDSRRILSRNIRKNNNLKRVNIAIFDDKSRTLDAIKKGL